MKSHLSVVLCSALLISACATKPIPNNAATPIPNEQILDFRFSSPTPNTGEVTIKRDSGFGGSACSTRIFVNGQPIADIYASEKIVLHLPSGEQILSSWPNGICGGGMSEVKTLVKAGTNSSFRVGYGSNGDFSINPTAF